MDNPSKQGKSILFTSSYINMAGLQTQQSKQLQKKPRKTQYDVCLLLFGNNYLHVENGLIQET